MTYWHRDTVGARTAILNMIHVKYINSKENGHG